MTFRYAVAGAGFSGAVLAERIASKLNEKVLLIDRRKHIGGTSYSEIETATGIEVHRYGSHIFHTSSSEVYDYLKRFTEFNTYQHKVLISSRGRIYQMPINLKTINDFYGIDLKPYEVENFIKKENSKIIFDRISNLEEKAISLIGEKLYNAFIKGYTKKQWDRDPKELPPEIIMRLPVRSNYNANYFNDPFQGIPLNGYGELFRKILDHPNIDLRLGVDFREIRDQLPAECTVFYSGSLDELFDYRFGELEWRSLNFEWKNLEYQDFQGTSVVNYADPEIPYTRIHEFKHYHPERSEVFQSKKTTICIEYPHAYQRGREAYYPVDTPENRKKYQQYRELLENSNIIPIGRLGAYKYWNMDQAVLNSLRIFEQFKEGKQRCPQRNH